MTLYIPDLTAELIPMKSAAGFNIGESFDAVQARIGAVAWYEKDNKIDERIAESSEWLGVLWHYGFKNNCGAGKSFVYRNDIICLEFEDNSPLYRIYVGKGYHRSFFGVMPGDTVRSLEKNFDLEFNEWDDDFLIGKNGIIIEGISFLTDCRASLEEAPEQIIEYICVRDWSLITGPSVG